VLQEGVELLGEWIDKRPTWHRAGNLAATRDTLRACRAVGLLGDSSFAYGWPQSSDLGIRREQRNDIQSLEGVVELPVTTFQSLPLFDNFRYLELKACTLNELCTVTRHAVKLRMPHVVFVMHSFSLVRRVGSGYYAAEADLDRFRRYLDFVAAEPGLLVESFCDLDLRSVAGPADESPGGRLGTGFVLTYGRAWEHRKRGWKNRAILLAPVVASAVALGAVWLLGLM
jgi:hypothetical protein